MQAPGTVSRILWHFTGGPTWNAAEKRQNREPKPPKQAYEALQGILQSRRLRTGQYMELVKVRIPKLKKFNREKRISEVHENVLVELQSAPVCCLADIPIAHLTYHALRYGKFAIGFHRDAAIQHGFNPVFYTLHDTKIIRSIWRGLGAWEEADTAAIDSAFRE